MDDQRWQMLDEWRDMDDERGKKKNKERLVLYDV